MAEKLYDAYIAYSKPKLLGSPMEDIAHAMVYEGVIERLHDHLLSFGHFESSVYVDPAFVKKGLALPEASDREAVKDKLAEEIRKQLVERYGGNRDCWRADYMPGANEFLISFYPELHAEWRNKKATS